MSIGSDSETVISRGDERPPVERRSKKKPPRSPSRGLERTGSNFSDNTSKYLGSVYTEYVREMDEPAVGRGGEASDLALEMQHEFNMKLAETIEKEHERKTPVYAEVRGEKKKGRSYNGSYKSELFVSEDIDATIDAAFKETFEEEDRHMNPVMGTEAILEKKKKREEKEKTRTKGERRKERHRGEKNGERERKERRSERSKERRMSKDSDTTIEASHHITVEVLLLSLCIDSSVDLKVGSSGQHFVDTIEDLKSSDEEERRRRARRGRDEGNGSRRSSIYFDESDGPFGTWKRVKLDK